MSPPDRDQPRRRQRRVRHGAGQACPRPPPGRHRRLRPLPEGHGREGDLPGEGTEPNALRGGVAGEKTKEVGRGNLQQMCKIAKPSICRQTLAALATILLVAVMSNGNVKPYRRKNNSIPRPRPNLSRCGFRPSPWRRWCPPSWPQCGEIASWPPSPLAPTPWPLQSWCTCCGPAGGGSTRRSPPPRREKGEAEEGGGDKGVSYFRR